MWEYLFCLGVASFLSHPITLQDSLMSNTTWNKESIYMIFLHGDKHKGKEASNTNTLAWFGQVCPLSSQNGEIFSQELLWMESVHTVSDYFILSFFLNLFPTSLVKLSRFPFSYDLFVLALFFGVSQFLFYISFISHDGDCVLNWLLTCDCQPRGMQKKD